MWKYIVTWVITTTIPAQQPEQVDEFGIKNYSANTLSILIVSSSSETNTKEFIVRDSAFVFYNKGKERLRSEWMGGFGSSITDIKIDSVKIDKN